MGNATKLVAPFTGAWIETSAGFVAAKVHCVAPFTGAWIETERSPSLLGQRLVAPFTGAWIETISASKAFAAANRRTLHGCVD